jgi:sugar fermentation stimulation protein A
MQFDEPLLPGTLIERYKRFMADVRLDRGETVTAHCANTGAMLGLTEPGSRVWLSRAANPKRKLAYTWELIQPTGAADGPDCFAGVNSMRPNAIAEEAIRAGAVAELTGYVGVRREVRYGENSRIDLHLEAPGKPVCYVEVKNAHLCRTRGLAEFPDSVTARGAKHLRELTHMVAAGHRAVMLYVVQRTDCGRFAVSVDIDPAYGAALSLARQNGVEALCYACTISPTAITLDRALPLVGV